MCVVAADVFLMYLIKASGKGGPHSRKSASWVLALPSAVFVYLGIEVHITKNSEGKVVAADPLLSQLHGAGAATPAPLYFSIRALETLIMAGLVIHEWSHDEELDFHIDDYLYYVAIVLTALLYPTLWALWKAEEAGIRAGAPPDPDLKAQDISKTDAASTISSALQTSANVVAAVAK